MNETALEDFIGQLNLYLFIIAENLTGSDWHLLGEELHSEISHSGLDNSSLWHGCKLFV